MFTDVSSHFMFALQSFVSGASLIEVAEPGYEAITFSLITTATNLVKPLSYVISYQLLASFFPDLVEQSSIAADTPDIRRDFAALQCLVILLNLSSLLALPLLVSTTFVSMIHVISKTNDARIASSHGKRLRHRTW